MTDSPITRELDAPSRLNHVHSTEAGVNEARRLPLHIVVLPVFVLNEHGFRNSSFHTWPPAAALPVEHLPNRCRIPNRPISLKYNLVCVNPHIPRLGTRHGSKAGSTLLTPLEVVCWGLVRDYEEEYYDRNREGLKSLPCVRLFQVSVIFGLVDDGSTRCCRR